MIRGNVVELHAVVKQVATAEDYKYVDEVSAITTVSSPQNSKRYTSISILRSHVGLTAPSVLQCAQAIRMRNRIWL